MITKALSSVYPRTSFLLFLFTAFLLTATFAVAKDSSEGASSPMKHQSVAAGVDHKYVCMVNNQLYDKEQIPVVVDGKTYYGCCEMCKVTLKNNPKSRLAVDPISGKTVDKALSVIGLAPNGKVYYFESEENLRRFKESLNKLQ